MASVVPHGAEPSNAGQPITNLVAARSTSLKPSSIDFPRSVLVIWWGAICGVHLLALAYQARITSFYWRLPGYCRCVAVVNVAIATVHGVAVLRMIRNSARARQLIFYVDDIPDEDPGSSEKQSKIRQLYSVVVGLFAYKGPLGVEGKYFDFLLYTAEFVGALLQTYQAGRIAHKRLLSLMCDCVLDLVSSVVVPATLFFVYLDDYVPATRSFERTRWYDDRWLVHLWSEHDLIVITSWIDALSRLIFAIALLFSMESEKQLLRVETIAPTKRPVLFRRLTRQFMQLVGASTTHEGSWTTAVNRRLTPLMRYSAETIVHQLQRVRWAAIFHAILALWGVVVVGIHTSAEIKHASTPQLSVCPIQFSKWAHNAPVCLLLDIDCQALGISGTADEIETHWRDVDPSSVLRLNLKSIKLYNVTLVSWNRSESFTDTLLPKIRSLQFTRVNFSGAKLPEGLTSVDFPQRVRIIEFCVTNLGDLASELEHIWPKGLRLSLESSAFTSFPFVALRLLPRLLSVSGNAIEQAPAELFQSLGISRIDLAHTLISTLPSNFSTPSSTLRQISIAHTGLTGTTSQWMDAVVDRAEHVPYVVVALFAGGTPFCDEDLNRNLATRSRTISCVSSLDEISYPLAFEGKQSRWRCKPTVP